jgi:hypothetical protein
MWEGVGGASARSLTAPSGSSRSEGREAGRVVWLICGHARAVHTCGLAPIQSDPASRARCCSRISNAGVLAILAALSGLRLDACTRRTTSLRVQQPVVVCVWG